MLQGRLRPMLVATYKGLEMKMFPMARQPVEHKKS